MYCVYSKEAGEEMKEYTAREALDLVKDSNEILVSTSDFIQYGDSYSWVLQIVAMDGFWEEEKPQAYTVEITRPNFMYGSEGILYGAGLRFLGFLRDDTYEEDISDEEYEKVPDGRRIWAFKDTAPARANDSIKWKRFNPFEDMIKTR